MIGLCRRDKVTGWCFEMDVAVSGDGEVDEQEAHNHRGSGKEVTC